MTEEAGGPKPPRAHAMTKATQRLRTRATSVARRGLHDPGAYPVLATAWLTLAALLLPPVVALLVALAAVYVLPVLGWWRLKGKGHRHSRRATLSWALTGSDRKVGDSPLWRFVVFRCVFPATVYVGVLNLSGSAGEYGVALLIVAPLVTVFGWGRPWWKELRYRRGREPAYDGSLIGPSPGTGTEERRQQLDALGADYQRAAETLRLPASRIAGSANDGYAETLTIEAVPGNSLIGYEGKIAQWYASRYGIAPGDVEVSPDRRNGRNWTVRAQYADPHAVTLPFKGTAWREGAGPRSLMTVGSFRNGRPIRLDPAAHTLIAGQTGSGKSKLLDLLLHAYAENPNWLIIGIDPGSMFERWHPVMRALATGKGQAHELLSTLAVALRAREKALSAYCAERGLAPDEWQLVLGPRLVVMIDELADFLRDDRNHDAYLLLLERGRKCGITLVSAIQNPTNENMGKSGSSRAQFQQMVSFAMARGENTNAVFGPGAVGAGWAPHELNAKRDPGRCYVYSPESDIPLLGLTEKISDQQVRTVRTVSPLLDDDTANALMEAEFTAARDTPVEQALRELGPATVRQVAEHAELEQQAARRRLNALVSANRIDDTGRQGQGNAKLYRLLND